MNTAPTNEEARAYRMANHAMIGEDVNLFGPPYSRAEKIGGAILGGSLVLVVCFSLAKNTDDRRSRSSSEPAASAAVIVSAPANNK